LAMVVMEVDVGVLLLWVSVVETWSIWVLRIVEDDDDDDDDEDDYDGAYAND